MIVVLVALWPLLVALVGLVVYVLSSNAKSQEIGRAMLWCGLLLVTLALAHQSVRLP